MLSMDDVIIKLYVRDVVNIHVTPLQVNSSGDIYTRGYQNVRRLSLFNQNP